MARNKKNSKKETFNVYPYLGQYQYLMRTGGQLPWYQDKGPVESDEDCPPIKHDFGWNNDRQVDGRTVPGFDTKEQRDKYQAALQACQDKKGGPDSDMDIQFEGKGCSKEAQKACENRGGKWNYNKDLKQCECAGGDYTNESADNECICPEGYERAGETYFSSGPCDGAFGSMCGKKLDNKEDANNEEDTKNTKKEGKLSFKEWVLEDPVRRQGPNAQEEYKKYLEGTTDTDGTDDGTTDGTTDGTDDGTTDGTDEGTDDGTDDGTDVETCEDSKYIECAQKGLKTDPNTCECIEEVEEVSDNVKQKAIEDYQNGLISKKEMEDITMSHNLGKGLKKGTPDYEFSPTSKWGLLADALNSTGQAIKGFGRQSINPRTGKPYTKADFKQTTIDSTKLSNVNDAKLHWDYETLNKFINQEEGYEDLNVSDLIGTQNMHSARRFNQFQDNRDANIEMLQKEGLLNEGPIVSRQTMDRKSGDITYDDVEYQEDVEVPNPKYISEEETPGVSPTITETVTKTRPFNPETDRTDFDKARDHTKDYSTKAIFVNKNADVTNLVRTGPEANPNVIDDEGLTPYQIETYDPDRTYKDNVEIKKSTSQHEKNIKDGNVEDDSVDESGPTVESEVDNGDGTFTITYSDGSTKTVKRGSSQGDKNKTQEDNKDEANMGLEMFVYGGQKRLDKYQKKGEKVNQMLEYIPGFPRTGGVEFGPGNFTAEDYQNAITRDSTALSNYIQEHPIRSYFMGSNQDHASSAGSLSGNIQLNREWLHKLLMQDDQERASKLNFYRNGGALPFYQDGDEKDNKDKSDGPSDAPKDNNAEPKEVPTDNTNEEVNDDATDPNANATPPPDGSPEGDGTTPDGSPEGETHMTDEEMNEMDETSLEDSDVIDSGYGNWWNRTKAATRTGIVDRAINTYGDVAGAVTKWADFGNAVLEGWQNEAAETKAKFSNTTGEDQFMVQESSQGIHDVNSGDSFTNEKVDEIYSGNTMKAPLIMQMGGQGMAQPVVDNVNYAALAEFTGTNPYNVEIGYSPEVIAYQKQIMAKMAYGGQLPMAQDGWWDKAKNWYEETDFKTPINKGLDYAQTAMSAAGTVPIVGNVVDAVNTATSGARAGYAAYEGDTDAVTKHTENMALNAASMIPGAGIAVGAASVAKDAAEYAGVTDGRSMTAQVADAVTPDKKDGKSPSALIAKAESTAPPKTDKPAPPPVTAKKEESKIDKVARYGTEVEVDYELLQELIKAGADIEII